MSRRVSVHHFVANLTTRQYGPGQRTSDLLDVNYWREVPADTEFPRVFGRLDLFTRFYLRRRTGRVLCKGVVGGHTAATSRTCRPVRPVPGPFSC